MAHTSDVLAEDRLLWEFWLNHGLDHEALRKRFRELPPEANGEYLAGNALYGGFESGFRRLVEAERAMAPSGVEIQSVLRGFLEAPAVRVTPDVPEGRLLAALSTRSEPGGPEARRTEEASRGVRSWPAFLRAACRSNLVLPVADSLQRCAPEGIVPEGIRHGLERAASGIRERNRRLLALLRRLLEAYESSGVSVVLLKESALLLDVYAGEGDRMIGDLDLLFASPEVDKAEKVLVEMGYTPFEGIWSRAWYRNHHHHLAPLVSATEAVKIEPHTGIWIPTGSSAPIIPEMIAASSPHPALAARKPAATHLLFQMLVDLHGNASIGKLGQMGDVVALLRAAGSEVDAALLSDLARRTGSLPWVQDALYLITEVHGREMLERHAPGLRALQEGGPLSAERRFLRRVARANLFGFEPGASTLSVAGVRLVHRALMHPGGRLARAGFLLRSALGLRREEAGAGPLARQARSSSIRHLGRAITFPVRILAQAFRTKRG
jgi:hypothetical protein